MCSYADNCPNYCCQLYPDDGYCAAAECPEEYYNGHPIAWCEGCESLDKYLQDKDYCHPQSCFGD